MLLVKVNDLWMKKETQQDADSEHRLTMPLWMPKLYVKILYQFINLITAYEKLVCKAPAEFKLVPPASFPEDVPFSIALTSDEYDPWTETSHKFRFYD